MGIENLVTRGSEDSYEESPLVCHKKKFKQSDRPSCLKNSRHMLVSTGSQPDQALINERILTQVDTIGKGLTSIEQNSASVHRPKAKKVVSDRGTASSSLTEAVIEGDSYKKLPDLQHLRHDRSIQDQVKARIRQLLDVDAKGIIICHSPWKEFSSVSDQTVRQVASID